MTPDAPTLGQIRDLLQEARFFSAWQLAEPLARLRDWPAGEARHLAAGLAGELGSTRLGSVWRRLNSRQFPEDEKISLSGALCKIRSLGPFRMLDLVEARAGRCKEDEARADWLALQGFLLGRLHDFARAHAAVNQAISIAPAASWPMVQRSQVLEMEDRYPEALEQAREALALAPRKVSCVLQTVDCLIHLGADDEATALLESESARNETPTFAERLVLIYSEREDYKNALRCLDVHDRLSPLADGDSRDWSHRRRADMLYLAGDFEGFLENADLTHQHTKPRDKASPSYHQRVSAHMRQPGALARKRKRLPVPFVRQHDMTCAPATMAALAAYWGKKHDHLEIADSICHDGTPWHKERQWAESNGFIATEFKVNHEILVALIDRGVPFTLCTEAVTSAHLQACIGYDDRQGVALLRDPTERHYGEVILEGLIEDHPVQGPRGMLILPDEEADRIAGLMFPDAAVYAAHHHVLVALDAHDRRAAREAVNTMPQDHPMTLWAEYRLAGYDRNPVAEFHAIDALSARFPENAPLRFSRLGVLDRLQDRARQKEALEAEFRRPSFDPIYYSEMGEFLSRDSRQFDLADYYLRKAVRRRPSTSRVYASMAWCLWKEHRFADSARYRRIASCMNPAWEPDAAAYAEGCRVLGRPQEGLDFLRRRVDAAGHRSAGPWQTLTDELEAQSNTPEAMGVLDRGLAARPDDGELLLAAGRLFTGWGEREKGEGLLLQARGKVREAEWHREMARNEAFFGHRQPAIEHWRAVLLLEPFSVEAHRALARLLAEENGTSAAIAFLVDATGQHSQIPSLWTLRAEWEAVLGPKEAIFSLRKALVLDPDYVYALRELSLQLSKAGEGEAALAAAHEAVRKNPTAPSSAGILASILEDLSRIEEARENYLAAIRRDVDYTFASERLVQIAPDSPARLEALRLIESEMRRQVSDGSIVPVYQTLAYRYLEPADLLEQLRGFCNERPDLWETWRARREQAIDMDLLDEAMLCAEELITRFPLMPRAWVEMALTQRSRGDHQKEVAMLEKAVALSPAWGWAARLLSEALERVGRYDEALTVLERNLQHEPLAGESYGYVADLLWKKGQHQNAFERLLGGMEHCPTYDWGWTRLAQWALILHREEDVIRVMDSHLPSREHLVGWWVQTAEILGDLSRTEAALECTARGLQRHPDAVELLEKKAALLTDLGRFDSALATCSEALEKHPGARTLRGRQAFCLMASGQPNEAIRQMTLLTAEHPDYLWAIRQLASWLSRRQRWEELRALARQWIRQNPQAAPAYGYLGEAEQNLSHRTEAKNALARAFALDPAYSYAGRNLLSYQINDEEFDAAETTLQALQHHLTSEEAMGDALELALARKHFENADNIAREMLLLPQVTPDQFSWISGLYAKQGRATEWWRYLDSAARLATPLAPVLEAWIRSLPERGKIGRAPRRLRKLRNTHQEDLAATGWIALLDVVDPKKYGGKVRRWIRWNRRWFHSRNDLWAAVGNSLTGLHDYRAAAKWMADWNERGDDLHPDALFNCGVAIEHVQGWKASMAVRQVMLARFPNIALSPSLRGTLALFTALDGDRKAARHLGNEVETGKLSKYYGGIFALYQSLACAEDGDLTTAEAHYQEALKTMNSYEADKSVGVLFKESVALLSLLVPWAKGKPAKIRRKWGRYQGASNSQVRGWQIGLCLIVLYHVIKALVAHWAP